MGAHPLQNVQTKFGIRGRTADVIICLKFYQNHLRGFWSVKGQNWEFPIDFDSHPYNTAACDCIVYHYICALYICMITLLSV